MKPWMQLVLDRKTYSLNALSFHRFQYLLWAFSGLGFGANTVQMLLMSVANPMLLAHFNTTATHLGFLVTGMFVGEIVGAAIWAWISDRWGRKYVWIGTAAWTALFGALSACCSSLHVLVVYRILTGFGLGGAMAIDLVYFLEFVPAKNRGRRTAFVVFVGILGLLYVALAGALCRPMWRWFLAACCIPSVALFLGRLCWMYETPRYLATKGRLVEAQQVLRKMSEWNKRPLPQGTLASILQSTFPQKNDFTFLDTFGPKLRRQACLVGLIFMCHTFAYYGLTNWLGRLAASRGIPHLDICLALAINAIAEMPGLLLTVILIESVGRRWVLTGNLVGIILTCISMILFVNTQLTFIISSAFLYFFIVSVWASIYIYLPELFPTQLRSRAFAVCATFAKVGGMISPIVFGRLWDKVKASGDVGNGGVVVLSLVVGVYAVGVLSSVMLPVETAGKELVDKM